MDQSLAVAFAGTPDFALPALDAIASSRHRLVVVYSQPDRPAGRGRRVATSPVKERALALGLTVRQPESLREAAAAAELAAFAPDVLVVVAYGLLLPPTLLDVPRLGCLNIHASLLPRWRGAAPVARAIMAGDAKTGVCIMRLEAGLDTGPVMMRQEVEIAAHETAGDLQARLALLGAPLIVAELDLLATGRATFAAQDARQATYAKKLEKSEARLAWGESARVLARQVRAMNPWPIAETTLDGAQLRIFEAEVVAQDSVGAVPGTILRAGAEGIVVLTGDQALAIRRLQLPGRRAVPAADFANARRLAGLVLA